MTEGYIKFNCTWIESGPVQSEFVRKLNKWRNRLFELGLIGIYPNGIGFGNISLRYKRNTFIITGSATGGLKSLTENHYTLVKDYNLNENSLTCAGPIKASSESLSHAAVYESWPAATAVIHVHHAALWKKLLHIAPTTSQKAAFGTPELALEIRHLFRESEVKKEKIIIMGGHSEGIISFGQSLEDAGQVLLENLKKV
jgi:ribulose-5-phosphate 4-epimerase/fuculose-1-phosphate aldolase